MSASALHAVETRISVELGRERAAGWPLKAAYDHVARRLGITARRVRAFHHREVSAGAVTAEELLRVSAAHQAEFAEVIQRLEALREIVSAVESGDPLRGLALPTMVGGGTGEIPGGGAVDLPRAGLGASGATAAAAAGHPGAD